MKKTLWICVTIFAIELIICGILAMLLPPYLNVYLSLGYLLLCIVAMYIYSYYVYKKELVGDK